MRMDLAKELGIRTKLKADAVPSIDIANESVDSGTTFRERKQVGPKTNHSRFKIRSLLL